MTSAPITLATLQAAGVCKSGIEAFVAAFPDGIPSDKQAALTIALEHSTALKFDCGARLLPAEPRRAYRAALAEPRRAYRAAIKEALHAYRTTTVGSCRAYEAAITEAYRAYDAATAEAFVDAYFWREQND